MNNNILEIVRFIVSKPSEGDTWTIMIKSTKEIALSSVKSLVRVGIWSTSTSFETNGCEIYKVFIVTIRDLEELHSIAIEAAVKAIFNKFKYGCKPVTISNPIYFNDEEDYSPESDFDFDVDLIEEFKQGLEDQIEEPAYACPSPVEPFPNLPNLNKIRQISTFI